MATEGALPVRQAAIASLGAIQSAESEQVLGRMMEELLSEKLPAASAKLHLVTPRSLP